MLEPDLTDQETDALARLLRDTIDADHCPLSPRVQMWKDILAKIRPEAKPEPLPPLKRYEPPRAGRIPATVKGSYSGPPMTLGNAAAARVRLIV